MMPQQDSLDQERNLYMRSQSSHPSNPQSKDLNGQTKVYKNFYKQQLDQLVIQKNQHKRQQKEREIRQRNMYNERVIQGVQAQKLKDLSYKNYYQMLLNNQNSNTKAYVNPYHERDHQRQKFIANGVEIEKKRSEAWQQQQRRRNEEMKKNYRQLLADQINEKNHRNVIDKEVKIQQQQAYKQITYTPQELAKLDRQRRLMEMNKYKQDLDQSSPITMTSSRMKQKIERERSFTNPQLKNDFNMSKIQGHHNPMVNPMPYNIQNPYILKQMKRKQELLNQSGGYYSNY